MMDSHLFYVVGASGVGKDSLLSYAQQHLPANAPVTFAHRYITRPADAGYENHIALSQSAFQQRLQHGCFAMHWFSHGLYYGIGSEIVHWLDKGLSVVVNGSREYLDQASQDFPQLLPILIQANQATLEQRLYARGRESAKAIKQRLARAAELDQAVSHPKLVRINNDAELAVAGQTLISVLLHWQAKPSKLNLWQ